MPDERALPKSGSFAVNKANTRADYFRFVYANGWAVQFNGSELILYVGVLHDMGDYSRGIEEQVAIAMTATNMKALGLTLTKLTSDYEKKVGHIPINPEFEASLEKLFVAAVPPDQNTKK